VIEVFRVTIDHKNRMEARKLAWEKLREQLKDRPGDFDRVTLDRTNRLTENF